MKTLAALEGFLYRVPEYTFYMNLYYCERNTNLRICNILSVAIVYTTERIFPRVITYGEHMKWDPEYLPKAVLRFTSAPAMSVSTRNVGPTPLPQFTRFHNSNVPVLTASRHFSSIFQYWNHIGAASVFTKEVQNIWKRQMFILIKKQIEFLISMYFPLVLFTMRSFKVDD